MNCIIPPVFDCFSAPPVLLCLDVKARFVLGNKGSEKSLGTRGRGLHVGYTLLIEGRKMCISSVVRGGGQSSEAN